MSGLVVAADYKQGTLLDSSYVLEIAHGRVSQVKNCSRTETTKPTLNSISKYLNSDVDIRS